jgi:hypothetical protein
MKVGDLVKHKRTGAIGMLFYVPKRAHYGDWWFDVRWFDGCTVDNTSHVRGELELISEGR